jgi:hypothetical protein
MSYARRTDENHAAIRDALRGVPGVYVQDVSMYPGLGFDLIARYQYGAPVFLEIKTGPKVRLEPSEVKARDKYGDHWARVESFEDGLRALGIATERPPF